MNSKAGTKSWLSSAQILFISCVSPEFRKTRSKVANIVTGLAYTPVFQEIFGTESDDLRQVLRDKIDAYALAISPNNHWVVTGCEDPTLRQWDLSAKDPAANPVILRGHSLPFNAVAISPNNHWV